MQNENFRCQINQNVLSRQVIVNVIIYCGSKNMGCFDRRPSLLRCCFFLKCGYFSPLRNCRAPVEQRNLGYKNGDLLVGHQFYGCLLYTSRCV